MRYLIVFLLAVALVALMLVVAGQLGLLRGTAPDDLGVKEGKLKRISKTANCVSSQASLWTDHPMLAYAQIEPLAYSGDGKAAMAKLAAVVKSLPRTSVVSSESGYLYAHSTTALLKFTDDVEFYLDEPAGLIHVRSSSRLGQKDFGTNRARVETIRTLFAL